MDIAVQTCYRRKNDRKFCGLLTVCSQSYRKQKFKQSFCGKTTHKAMPIAQSIKGIINPKIDLSNQRRTSCLLAAAVQQDIGTSSFLDCFHICENRAPVAQDTRQCLEMLFKF